MFKIILTVKRRPGMSRADFRRYYEENHTALVRRLVPHAPLYRRNHIVDDGEIAGLRSLSADEAGFDCITELGFPSRAEAEAHIAAYLDPSIHPLIAADEAKFIDPDGLRFMIVETCETGSGA